MRAPWRGSARRRAAWFGLVAAVLLAHLLFGLRVLASVIGWNTAPPPRPIEITFAQRLQPSAPPVAAAAAPAPPAPAPARPPRAIRAPRASSAPASAAEPVDVAEAASPPASSSRQALDDEARALAERLEQAQQAAQAASAAASAAAAAQLAQAQAASAAAIAAAASGPAPAASAALAGPERRPLDWPPSTRLTYTVTGLVRGGNLYGDAAVEWRRDGAHYQVQSDVHITNLFTRRHIFSDGEITAQGLSPRHFEERLELPLGEARRNRIEFTDDDVVLPNGNRMIRFPQTQDEASQFVQFVWLFTVHPELARPGAEVDFPVALARSVRRYHYRVAAVESLDMPFGTVATLHLVPVPTGPRRPNEYTFEFWMAPTLQYLPIRVLIKNDELNYADLVLDALPLQATPVPAAAASAPASTASPNITPGDPP